MRASLLVAGALVSALALQSCERAPRGGAAEIQLIAATTSRDVGRVRELLASGADPGKAVEVDGRRQTAWFLALNQLRPGRPDLDDIALAMLKAGASPKSAWGTGRTGPSESFWKRFSGPSRRGGASAWSPLQIAATNGAAPVVRALIDAGSDPREGNPVLAQAIEAGEAGIVHMLVDAGADVNTTVGGVTPLLAAIGTRNVELMTYLEDHGAREKP